MGTDIHLRVERRVNGVWTKVDPPPEAWDPWLKQQAEKDDEDGYYSRRVKEVWYDDRNYKCFSILANVRNGYGVAGVDTGDCFVPVSEPRGLPEDLSAEIKQLHNDDYDLGDHSFSWLLVSELLAYNWQQTIKNRGVITWEAFLERMRAKDTSWPESYSGWISGPGIVVITRQEALDKLNSTGLAVHKDTKLYVQEEWESTYAEAAGRFYSEVLPNLQKLDADPNNVRIVFGFDS